MRLPATDKMDVRREMERQDHRALMWGVGGAAVFIELVTVAFCFSLVVIEPEWRFQTMGLWLSLMAQVLLVPMTLGLVAGLLWLARRITLNITLRGAIALIPIVLICVGVTVWRLGEVTPEKRFEEMTGIAPPSSVREIDYRIDQHDFNRLGHVLTAKIDPEQVDELWRALKMSPRTMVPSFQQRALIGTETYSVKHEDGVLWMEVARGREMVRFSWTESDRVSSQHR